jgi:hypothetical protein
MGLDKLNTHQRKIIDAMAKVQKNLIAFKKKMDSPLVVMKEGKIMHIKPWLEEQDKR